MKKRLSFLLISLLLVGCNISNPSDNNQNDSNTVTEIPAENLEVYLPFNGNALDEKNNTKTELNGPVLTSDKNGKENSAYKFDGENDFIKVNFDLNPSKRKKLTMTAWVKFTGELGEDTIQQVISHDDSAFDRSMGIDYRSESIGWSAFAGPNCEVLGSKKIETNTWTFLATSLDQDKKTIDFYINNEKLSKNDCEYGEGYDYFYIGSNPFFGEYFKGDIDEIRIYSETLSETQIKSIYDNTK